MYMYQNLKINKNKSIYSVRHWKNSTILVIHTSTVNGKGVGAGPMSKA